jgi:hypothetical protein
MWQLVFVACFTLATAACNRPTKQTSFGDSSSYRTTTRLRTLPIGTSIEATIRSELSSGTHRADESVEAVVTHNIRDLNGLVAIPRGSTVLLTIIALESAHGKGNRGGRISLGGNEITLESTVYAVIAHIDSTPYVLVARLIAKGTPTESAAALRDVERDVVVAAGTPIVLTLTQPLTVRPK